MNYLPFSGYWFYGGTSAVETAAYYCAYGLISYAPEAGLSVGGSMLMNPNTTMFM